MTDRVERILAVALLALATVAFFSEARSIYVAPQPNSIRWFGDETWLMTEAREHVATGVVRYPLARGTTLVDHKGMLLGMPWLSSLLYGTTVALSHADPVDTGRTVTLVLSAMVAALLFASARMLKVPMVLGALGVVMLVANRSFLFTSHSARPDMLAGLILLAVFAGSELLIERRTAGIRPVRAFALGVALVFLMLTSSVHLLTLLPGVALYAAWRLGVFQQVTTAAAFAAGGAGVAALLAIVYFATTGSLALLGSSSHAQFHDVISSIPILRPFSRSVQVANMVIRTKQFLAEAPAALLVFPVIGLAMWRLRRQRGTLAIVIAFMIAFFSWLLLEGAEVHYLMHIVPLMLLVTIVLLSRSIQLTGAWTAFTAVAIGGLLTILAVRDANTAYAEGSRLARSNDRAVSGVFAAIAADWQRPGLPNVLVEPPALEGLLKYPLRVMTDHFISFPRYSLAVDQYLDTLAVDYVILYNSPAYPKVRPSSDPFYQAIRSRAALIDLETGTVGDMGRSYFERSDFRDTLLVFRWHR